MGCFLTLIDLILCLVIAAKNGHGRLHIVAGTLYLVAGNVYDLYLQSDRVLINSI